MDELEFQRVLHLFPVVRTRDYTVSSLCRKTFNFGILHDLVIGDATSSNMLLSDDLKCPSIYLPFVTMTRMKVVSNRVQLAESEVQRQLTSQALSRLRDRMNSQIEGGSREKVIGGIDGQDAFWEKLKVAAAKKVGDADAEGFVKAFQHVYRKLVFEELSLSAAQRFVNSS